MNIVEINFSDLRGRRFNGFDLMTYLTANNCSVKQIVSEKMSDNENVIQVNKDFVMHNQILDIEKKYCIEGTLFPYGYEVYNMEIFKNADVIHFHILNNAFVSLFDYPRLMNYKSCIWTLHDPWSITGNCLYPLHCKKWKNGCINCTYEGDFSYEKNKSNMEFMWKLKENILKQVNPHVVVASDFMEKYVRQSPLTSHFDKIHKIPFGVDCKKYNSKDKHEKKRQYGLDINKITIGFRAENVTIKGSQYIYEALKECQMSEKIEILVVGLGIIPDNLKEQYHVVELGWLYNEQQMIDFYEACDIFLMPSLDETFGLMAIESMAAECAFICFKDTVLAEISNSPECGIAVEYKDADALAKQIEELVNNKKLITDLGIRGRKHIMENYRLETYQSEHLKLYKEVAEENKL